MKARFVKSLMCLVLAGTLVAGEVGTVFAAEPAAMETVAEETMEAEASEETEAEVSEDAEAEVPENAEVEAPEETEAEAPEETEAEVPENVEAEAPENVEAEVPEGVEAEVPKDVEAEVTEGVEAEASENAEAEAPEETEAEVPENVEAEAAKEIENQTLVVESQSALRAATTAATPKVESFSVDTYTYDRNAYLYLSGYGSKFEIYVNDILWETKNNYQEEWDDEKEEYVQESAPYYYEYINFYGMMPGVTYTFKVVPYNSDGTKGTAKTVTAKSDFPKITNINGYVSGTTAYDSNGNTTGYNRPYIYLSAGVSGMNGYSQSYEIYRAEGKKTAKYKKIATVNTSYSITYSDYDVVVGNTYYYKIRPVSGTDTYVPQQVNGTYSAVSEVVIAKPSVNCYVSYTEGSVSVYANATGFASGFEIYRSTSKTKGFKKIATISDTEYQDKSVKSGKTYYYKVKAFYFDVNKQKKYVGDYSEPAGVKLLMDSIYLETAQSGTNQVKLTWGKVTGANSYEIYYKTDLAGDAYKKLTETTKTSYIAKKLTTDTTYYFQIRACKKSGAVTSYYQSTNSSVYLGFKAPTNVRIASKSVSAKSTTKGTTVTIKSTLKWDRVYEATGYRIEAYDRTKGTYVTLKTITKNSTTSYKLTNTVSSTDGTKYSDIRIYAVNKKKESDYRTVSGYASLSNVTNVKAKKKSATSVTITWNKVVAADTYYVYRTAPTGYSIRIGTVTTNSFVDKTLTPGVNYTYSITAYNSKVNISGYTNYDEDGASTNTVVYNHKLSTPSISSVKNSSAKKATITWKKAAYAKKYVVYRSTSKNGTYKKVATVTGKTSYVDSKLTKGKTYYYKIEVQTTNDAGISVTSAKSAAKSVKIKK